MDVGTTEFGGNLKKSPALQSYEKEILNQMYTVLGFLKVTKSQGASSIVYSHGLSRIL